MATKRKRKQRGSTAFAWNDNRMLVRFFPNKTVQEVEDSDELWEMQKEVHGRRAGDEPYWQIVGSMLEFDFVGCTVNQR